MSTFKRRLAREKVLQVLYAFEISKEPLDFIQGQQLGDLKEKPEDYEFAIELIALTAKHIEQIDTLIRSKAENWDFKRLAVIDKTIIRMGVCEFLYFPEIPTTVTINESIEIVKLFSTEKSGRFVNGVLDSILKELRVKKQVHKIGRGLMESSAKSKTTSDTHEE